MSPGRTRFVYSSEGGSVCPGCGHPRAACRCAAREPEPIPERIAARLRLESKGRGGKSVTVIDGLPRNADYLAALCRELKRRLGTGGTVRDGALELQGDRRSELRELLREHGFRIQG